jgi:hypothetical protein
MASLDGKFVVTVRDRRGFWLALASFALSLIAVGMAFTDNGSCP